MRHATLPAGIRLETKSPGDDPIEELKAAFDTYHSEVQALAENQKAFEKRLEDGMNERLDEIEKKSNRIRVGRGSFDELGVEGERKALGELIKTGDDREIRSLSTGNDPEAGYLVMPNFSQVISKKVFDMSPVRRLARVISLPAGDSWAEPIDFSDVGAEWAGETQSRSETDNPNVGILTIPLNEIYAHQTVTQKLIDTSFANIGEWIEGKIADKFARTEGIAYTTGNGIRKPRGFLNYETDTADDTTRELWKLQVVNSGSATLVTADGLRDLYWALRSPYRKDASWLLSSATANAIDKLKDGNGDYLWRDGMTSGASPSLLGRPVEIDENMPAIEAGTTPIAFGDFRQGYTVVDRLGIKPLRDPYTSKPNVIIYVYKRTGGGVSNSEAIKLLKIAA